jgi:mycofactocin system glycosyltransferase
VTALDPGCRLDPTPDLRALDGGTILVGGAPLRILRLSRAGAEAARRWFAGQPIGDRTAHQRLAARLRSGGLAHLRWPTPAGTRESGSATVVIPARDDANGLARTLDDLVGRVGAGAPAGRIVVVDDGSTTPIAERRPRVELVRRDRPGGPGVARQVGLERVETPITVFVDAGVRLTDGALEGLVAAFDDPEVVAAAPRVRSEDGPGLVARYDRLRSPLDLGPVESLVGPGRMVPYVPTACLAVRTAEARAVGGFDAALRYGEDVDLVWRLGATGLVSYRPDLVAVHRPRATVGGLIAQRRSYGSAAAPLARRHGHEVLTPCRVSPWSALVLALGLAGRPGAAAATAVGTGVALRPKIEPMPAAGVEAMLLTLRGHHHGGLSILAALLRSWWPVAGVALLVGGQPRRLAARAVGVAALRRLVDGPRHPVDLAVDLGLGVVDDLAYGAGLWQGAIAERSVAALRPVMTSWPGGDRRPVIDRVRTALVRVGRRRPGQGAVATRR